MDGWREIGSNVNKCYENKVNKSLLQPVTPKQENFRSFGPLAHSVFPCCRLIKTQICAVLFGGRCVYVQDFFNCDSSIFHGPQPNRSAVQCVDSTVYDSTHHKEIAGVRS